MKDEFYIGYLPQAPAGIGRLAAAVTALSVLAALLLGALWTGAQATFATSSFEWGVATPLEGVIVLDPAPMLVLERPGSAGIEPRSRFLLTIAGKNGAGDAMRAFDGRRVRLEGALIHHAGRTMVEVDPSTIELLAGAAAPALAAPEQLGEATLTGEIVDSKCYLGVMKPGRMKPHRACAVRCIAGGVPPVLLVRDETGSAATYLLTGPDGESLGPDILDRIAQPIEIRGRVCRHDDLLVLASDPSTWRAP